MSYCQKLKENGNIESRILIGCAPYSAGCEEKIAVDETVF